MAYNPMNPQMNPMNPHDMKEKKDFHMLLDEISTYLWEGEAWHEKTANECRKIGVRGWGRWHEAEGCYDAKERYCLDKLMRDKLAYCPMVDTAMIDKALKYSINNLQDFKAHHNVWVDREEHFIHCLNEAIAQAGMVDMELYRKLCCIVDEVQNELMRVKMVMMRMDLGGWSGHDLGICSMILHDWFENHYDGGMIDFNLG